MTYTNTFEPVHDHVLVRLEGEINRPMAEDMSREGLTLGGGHGCGRYLLDWTKAKISASTVDIYIYALELYELGLRKCDRVAVIMSHDEDDKKDHRFFETVAKNRGWYNIHYFEEADRAIEWLKQTKE